MIFNWMCSLGKFRVSSYVWQIKWMNVINLFNHNENINKKHINNNNRTNVKRKTFTIQKSIYYMVYKSFINWKRPQKIFWLIKWHSNSWCSHHYLNQWFLQLLMVELFKGDVPFSETPIQVDNINTEKNNIYF